MRTSAKRFRLGLGLLFATGAFALPIEADAAHGVESELSRHGGFSMVVVDAPNDDANASCHVFFARHEQPKTPLFVVPDCVPGLSIVEGVSALGKLRFPVTQGEVEFHLFEIASARGGNAIHTMDYWVVTITPNGIWSQELDIGEPTIARIQSEPPGLILEEPATTTDVGKKLTIRFGGLSKVTLPKIARWVVNRKEQTLVGNLSGGFGYTGHRPVLIEGPRRETIIDEDGSCKLPDGGDDWGRVRLRAAFTTWNEGGTTVRCLSVTKLKTPSGR